MFAARLLFILTALHTVFADSVLNKSKMHDTLWGGDGGHPGAPQLPPEGIPKRAWIFDDLPILMTWTLAYIACGITFVLWLTGYVLRQWEDAVDRDDKFDESDHNEEQVGLFRKKAYDKDTVYSRGVDYGAVLQGSAETRI